MICPKCGTKLRNKGYGSRRKSSYHPPDYYRKWICKNCKIRIKEPVAPRVGAT